MLISFFNLLDPVPIYKENIDCEEPKYSSNSEIGSENPPGPGVWSFGFVKELKFSKYS